MEIYKKKGRANAFDQISPILGHPVYVRPPFFRNYAIDLPKDKYLMDLVTE